LFLIRQSQPDDVSTLSRMAKMVYFINLPPNEQIILGKIEHSNRCFASLGSGVSGPPRIPPSRGVTSLTAMEQDSVFFMFSMEDVGGGEDGDARAGSGRQAPQDRLVGTSQVRAHQGGPGNPNWAFKITEKKHYSDSLKFGTTHAVGQLYGDESGPTEIGGLIIQPSYRGHEQRPGRLLSFIRFHFIGLHRALFADRILAEMMAPVTAEGDNIIWDAFGRKFIPVKFAEADRFCQHNRSFIPELLPKEEIYLSLFPLEVQNALGVVSRETIPARRLLESMGFAYRGFVDPFDGGPHLDALTDDVPMIKETRMLSAGKAAKYEQCDTGAIVSCISSDAPAPGGRAGQRNTIAGGFRATQTRVLVDGQTVRMSANVMNLLGVRPGSRVGFTPVDSWLKRAEALTKEVASTTPFKQARPRPAPTPAARGKKAQPPRKRPTKVASKPASKRSSK